MMQLSPVLRTVHVEVSNNSGNWTPHGGAVFMLVNRSVILEVCGSQYEGQKVSDLCSRLRGEVCKAKVVLEFLRCGLYSSIDRNVCKQRLYVERYNDLVV